MSFDPAAWAALEPLLREVLCAHALGATSRPRGWIVGLLADPALREGDGPRPTDAQVKAAHVALRQAGGWLESDPRHPGQWRVDGAVLAGVSARLLDRVPLPRLRSALAAADQHPPQAAAARFGGFRLPGMEAALAWVRLEALGGASTLALNGLAPRLPWGVDSIAALLDQALSLGLDDVLFARLHPSVQAEQLLLSLNQVDHAWLPVRGLSLGRRLDEALARDKGPGSFLLRWAVAEHSLLTAEHALIAEVLAPTLADPDDASGAGRAALHQLFAAAVSAYAGRWAEAEAGFDEGLAALRKASGKRKGIVAPALGTAYAMALLAERRPAALDKALKFCLAEGGSREPVLDSPYGFIALAILMQQGQRPRDLAPFRPARLGPGQVSTLDPWRWLMRAWLKQGAEPEPLQAHEAEAAATLTARLRDCGLLGLDGLLDGALRVIGGESGPPGFFIPGPQPRWQQALQALQAVASPEAPAAADASAQPSRLLWLLAIDTHGRPEELIPHEQKRGPRGWSKPREVPLTRLQRGAESLPDHDAAVARAIRQEGWSKSLRIDLAAALPALLGHPALAFEEAPQTLVELVAGEPELDVQPDGADSLRVRMLPAMAPAPGARWATSAAEQKEFEALGGLRVLRDAPQRARLIRLTPAQRRVAQLLGPEGLLVPRSGAAQLQQVLSGLGSHFRIHTDDESAGPAAARELPADATLRAELIPVGEGGLQLRVVAAPFGPDHRAEGPRLVPGRGRARVVARLGGESLGVQRDLGRERVHLDTVLDACAQLPPPEDNAPAEWHLDDPELALAVVEALHGLPPDVVVMDWPQGRPLRVDTAGLNQLVLRIHTRQEWLAVQGEVTFDEGLVLGLQQLIGAATAKSRFVPLGEGRYLALTQELRDRLADLGAVADVAVVKGDDLAALRIPKVAAPWLREAMQGVQAVDHDAGFARCLQRLDEAQRVVPALPAALQATLRPYQEEGFEWAMRLAHAGLGACLADDMGLGKTLQALAVLLARAAGGPALVVVPTSVLGNWAAEARRFAPSLAVVAYAEQGAAGEREKALDALGANTLVLVSYPLLLADAEAFARPRWHTLVLDEAQAIKNAAAKRSQAVFGLKSAFTLALSGTPVENRLGELWSVMRACNPGLLGTAARFAERFAGPIERQQDKRAQRQLRRLIAPFVLRRTKAQVLDDLPPRTELVLRVQPDEAERAHYEALRRDALIAAERSLEGDAPGQAHMNVLAGLTRLRRAACDPRLVTPQLTRAGAKVQAFGELAAELVANGHKTLVFSQFVDFLALLKKPLDEAGIRYQYLDGSTPAAERTKRVAAFQAGEGDLFLISLKAGGLGLNLTVADYVVIADPWWNPATEDQATGRAHRIGQQRPVTVYRLVNEGTLEDRILTLHRDKRELADALFDGTDGTARLPPADELLALMRGDDAVADLYRSGDPADMG